MSLMRKKLSEQTAHEVCAYIADRYMIEGLYDEVYRIVDNNLGFIVDIIEEHAVELDIK